ncbi:unnamed protein product [Victoria cruziana]
MDDVVEECKLFYFVGQGTTAVILTWTMVVLSMHLKWQVRARDEVLRICGNKIPTSTQLNHLKIIVKGFKGLPLALKVIGGSLRQEPIMKWRKTTHMLVQGNQVFDIHSDLLRSEAGDVDESFSDLFIFQYDMLRELAIFASCVNNGHQSARLILSEGDLLKISQQQKEHASLVEIVFFHTGA